NRAGSGLQELSCPESPPGHDRSGGDQPADRAEQYFRDVRDRLVAGDGGYTDGASVVLCVPEISPRTGGDGQKEEAASGERGRQMKGKGLNRDVIKYIAMFTMLLNHIVNIFITPGSPLLTLLLDIGYLSSSGICYFLY